MPSARELNRVTLVERPALQVPGGPRVRRYSLARIAPSPVSALGIDRHERLERAAEARADGAEVSRDGAEDPPPADQGPDR